MDSFQLAVPSSSSTPAPAPNVPAQPVKIYNAVYSSVQVYECMVRGIAVMRRRTDSYVNATQILKVAGVDKGRRTKILEKEILPGKHEIVQGGYGKYQGTWIPLDRGRDIAAQYHVAELLAPLFDFVPSSASANAMAAAMSMSIAGLPASPFPSSSSSASAPGPPPTIVPGSALRLLNQGRAQGLFTPSSSLFASSPAVVAAPSVFSSPAVSPTPPPILAPPVYDSGRPQPLKRARSDTDAAPGHDPNFDALQAILQAQHFSGLAPPPPLPMPPQQQQQQQQHNGVVDDPTRPTSTALLPALEDIGSPAKRARTEPPPALPVVSPPPPQPQQQPAPAVAPPAAPTNGGTSITIADIEAAHAAHDAANADTAPPPSAPTHDPRTRLATKPVMPRGDRSAPLKDHRRALVVAAIVQRDEPDAVLALLRDIPPDDGSPPPCVDTVLDELGHTALHIAASMGRVHTVRALLSAGADAHRGNYHGETPLVRAALMTNGFDAQSFGALVHALHASVRTLDTARKSVLHHVVALAGVPNRALVAGYYLEQIFMWIARNERGDFRSLVDLQDEHGDTALNIAARVGNRSLVRSLVDVGANRVLPNKLGLRPGDFGVEPDELGVEDGTNGGGSISATSTNGSANGSGGNANFIASLRTTGPPPAVHKAQDVVADVTRIVNGLSVEFAAELKAKQDALDVTQAHLRAATRELSEQRKQIGAWQARGGELERVRQRIRNVERAVVGGGGEGGGVGGVDWTGRTGDGAVGAFAKLDPKKQQPPPPQQAQQQQGEPLPPQTDSAASLVRMRRLRAWQARVEQLVERELTRLRGASAEKEFQYRKIIALCTGVAPDKIDSILDTLVLAIESETATLDIAPLSGFMQKVRDGVI